MSVFDVMLSFVELYFSFPVLIAVLFYSPFDAGFTSFKAG
jgi:hypothetical protein